MQLYRIVVRTSTYVCRVRGTLCISDGIVDSDPIIPKDSIKDNDNDKTIRRGFRTTPLYSYSDMAVTDSQLRDPLPPAQGPGPRGCYNTWLS